MIREWMLELDPDILAAVIFVLVFAVTGLLVHLVDDDEK
jgi:hypothetical protein